MIGTFICIFAPDIYWLNAGRLIQGIGMGGVVSVSRAIIPDLFKGAAMAKYNSYIMMGMPLILAIAPVLGWLYTIIQFLERHLCFCFFI